MPAHELTQLTPVQLPVTQLAFPRDTLSGKENEGISFGTDLEGR